MKETEILAQTLPGGSAEQSREAAMVKGVTYMVERARAKGIKGVSP